jgi:prepilin-type N-terminal cleavage/methylation domain-containing protein
MNILNMKEPSQVSSNDLNRGFSIVELVVVMVVLGILLGAMVSSSFGYQASARNRERANDINSISKSLEQYHRMQSDATGATYPDSSTTATSLAATVNDNEIISAPNETNNSLVVATVSGAQTPTLSQYVYQPLNVEGTLCTALPCARYRLYYQLETTNVVVVKNSLRQQL